VVIFGGEDHHDEIGGYAVDGSEVNRRLKPHEKPYGSIDSLYCRVRDCHPTTEADCRAVLSLEKGIEHLAGVEIDHSGPDTGQLLQDGVLVRTGKAWDDPVRRDEIRNFHDVSVPQGKPSRARAWPPSCLFF